MKQNVPNPKTVPFIGTTVEGSRSRRVLHPEGPYSDSKPFGGFLEADELGWRVRERTLPDGSDRKHDPCVPS